ncbi:hypothetical protein [Mucilaginibacter sp.]|uniref:hypothetical protein n=1 Tax=Mucilaginibacter sp. TaxID=1882438 RepID=UPI00262613FD|nr:hypothetical protein [Mucilaginibacter sp.]MDB4920796.1 hypothetical protein [Mucilaginibacter sp.]
MLQKNLTLILLGIALVFFSEASLAQFPGMQQVRTQMNNQFINQQMNMMMRMNMSMRSRASNSSKIPGAENEYTYKVVMKDGPQQTITSYIYFDTLQKKSYLLLVDKRYPRSDTAHRKVKIYSTQTISISRDVTPSNPDDSAKQVWFDGMATDSCWLFHAIKGKINLYSFVSEFGNSYLFDPSTIAAVQYGTSVMGKFEPDALKAFIGNDEKAMKYFDKKDYFDAVKRYNKDAAKLPD